MCVTVHDIYSIIQEIAPFETAEAFDNVGLLLGKGNQSVSRILIALDVTMDVMEEAKELGAELIISHHPLLFRARKNLVENDPEALILCEMIRNHISLISAHTNLDQTQWSGSACCAELLGLKNMRKEGSFLFLGDLEHPMTAEALCALISAHLSVEARFYGTADKLITTLAVAGGAYDEGWLAAMEAGAQALLTGEVRHHNALSASMSNFVLYDGGHYATEVPLVSKLANYLQNRLNAVKYNVRVFPSQRTPFEAFK